jgi:formylglycine-generating enzyme required for sulfatase activity/tRNA A-37 threonylcarbamoyl transferase component Bud32
MPKANDLIGPYQLIRKLGAGGFGEVWLALDSSGSTPREVAVKTPLNQEIDLDALLQEATVWARVTGHPNVLEFLAARVFDGQVALVSEYAPDGSLKDWLSRHGGRAPSIEAAVEMMRGILAGLEHLHTRSIIHRDIKPENVLLLGATPRLADFGISRVLKSTSKSVITAGTPLYMAPEAFNRKRNQQTDLWSAGVMLYQMLSGRLPFDGADLTELYGAILNENPEPLPAPVPEWLRQAVAKALTKKPERRYQTAAEMGAALAPPTPRIEEKPALPPRLMALVEEHSPKRELTVVEPQPPNRNPIISNSPQPNPVPAVPRPHHLSKWLMGLLAGVLVIALTIYLATNSAAPPSFTVGNSASDEQTFTEDLNGVKLEMVGVPGGEFLMGSPESEEEHYDVEKPQHRVSVQAFSIGKYEITQAQWKAVMGGNNPSKFNGDDLPVESVSWNDAKEFCQKLARMTGKRYGLPSEAEWEYACRAGTTGAYAGNLDSMAWYGSNSDGKTHLVGQKQANAFGLYDMHGNVWEWCEDVWHDSYGGRHGNPPTDGSAWLSGGDSGFRSLRGGSWHLFSWDLRSSFRLRLAPGERSSVIGLRVAVSARTQ